MKEQNLPQLVTKFQPVDKAHKSVTCQELFFC